MNVFVVLRNGTYYGGKELESIFEDFEDAKDYADLISKHSEDTYSVEEWPLIAYSGC